MSQSGKGEGGRREQEVEVKELMIFFSRFPRYSMFRNAAVAQSGLNQSQLSKTLRTEIYALKSPESRSQRLKVTKEGGGGGESKK